MEKEFSTEKVEKIKRVKEKYEQFLLSVPNVVGVGIGRPSFEEGGNELCLRVYVEKDVDLMRIILAKEIEGVRVAVVEVGKVIIY